MNFVWEARERERDYQAHKSQMIKTVALAMEDELKNMGKPELICHICEELMNVLKQARVNWSIKYLRKCLDERYKNPTNRANALLRHKRDGPPGTPPDTGLTAEQLQEVLNRRPEGWGKEYVVATTLTYTQEIHSRKEYQELSHMFNAMMSASAPSVRKTKYDVIMHMRVPLKVTCRPSEQDVVVELNIDELNRIKASSPPREIKVEEQDVNDL